MSHIVCSSNWYIESIRRYICIVLPFYLFHNIYYAVVLCIEYFAYPTIFELDQLDIAL